VTTQVQAALIEGGPDASRGVLSARQEPADRRDASTDPAFVSVIVPVRNDVDGVRELVRCLAEQTLSQSRFEVVVGDDGSDPGTLAGVAMPDGWVRVVSEAPRNAYAARNHAVAAATGGVLAFCDSDCRPDATWLEEGLVALEEADVVAGEVVFVAPAKASVWSLLTIDLFLDQRQNVDLERGVTANLFVRRAILERVGGFDPSMPSGGDYDFVRRAVRLGARLVYAPRAVVRHPTLDNRAALLRKVWFSNFWSAARLSRDGGFPDPIGTLLMVVPVIGAARARRKALRPVFRLERRRLQAAALRSGTREELRALAALYFFIAYVAGMARVVGWIRGRRLPRPGLAARRS
jgi:glycosyltransferase involved in cell wall biosynthesis